MTQAQTEIYEEHYTKILVYARKLIKNDEAVEDCVVFCFLELFNHWPRPLDNGRVFLYEKAKEFCSKYLIETFGHDPNTEKDYELMRIFGDLVDKLKKNGFDESNLNTLKGLK